MTALFAPVCSITPTKRRRYLWAAWWTTPPAEDPFRKPDASQGGARTRDEAKRGAEKAAGRTLVEIEPRWARAWTRILVGEPPWSERKGRRDHPAETPSASVWTILGITAKATDAEIKRAFRKRALETHPDHGGEAEAFRAVKEAYEKALLRRKKTALRPKAKRGESS
ncbi:MAG: J domain-containing protein [Polyangiaceae bacterium]